MSRRIFLDVGGNVGQSLEEAVKPCWRFDHLWSFEPMAEEAAVLAERFGGLANVTVCPYGLLDRSGWVPVYGTNACIEASIWPQKTDVDADVIHLCPMVEASEFFRANIAADDYVIMKLNCEGAEVLILDNLADSGELDKVGAAMIDPDINRVPGEEQTLVDLLARFEAIGFDRYQMADRVMKGDTHQDRIAHWLSGLGVHL